MEDLDRPFPHRWLRHRFRQRIQLLCVHSERPDRARFASIDVVHIDEDLDELAHPPLTRRPLRTSRELGHQHGRRTRQVTGRVDTIDRFDGRNPRAWLLTILRNTPQQSQPSTASRVPPGRRWYVEPTRSGRRRRTDRRQHRRFEDCARCGLEADTYSRIKDALGDCREEVPADSLTRLLQFSRRLTHGDASEAP